LGLERSKRLPFQARAIGGVEILNPHPFPNQGETDMPAGNGVILQRQINKGRISTENKSPSLTPDDIGIDPEPDRPPFLAIPALNHPTPPRNRGKTRGFPQL
jgi:hypothetical protein